MKPRLQLPDFISELVVSTAERPEVHGGLVDTKPMPVKGYGGDGVYHRAGGAFTRGSDTPGGSYLLSVVTTMITLASGSSRNRLAPSEAQK